MTVLEMLTEKVPFASTALDAVVILDLYRDPGHRPARPTTNDLPNGSGVSDGVWRCLEECWSRDAKLRPSAAQIQRLLLLEIEVDEGMSNGEHADFTV